MLTQDATSRVAEDIYDHYKSSLWRFLLQFYIILAIIVVLVVISIVFLLCIHIKMISLFHNILSFFSMIPVNSIIFFIDRAKEFIERHNLHPEKEDTDKEKKKKLHEEEIEI